MNDTLPLNIAEALAQGLELLRPLTGEDVFNPAVPAALVRAGLQRLPVPLKDGGLGGGLVDAMRVLAELGSVDGSAALGLAMHYQTLGAAMELQSWPPALLNEVISAVCEQGALINLAATEARGGSPARGVLPWVTARRQGSNWVINGEKRWTTWLPALRYAVVTARIVDSHPSVIEKKLRLGSFLLDLSLPGVERLPAFDGLGMRASASGILNLKDVCLDDDRLIAASIARVNDPRRVSAQAWFGLCVSAVYLGVGEGARNALLPWAVERKPGDSRTTVAEIPSVRHRLGKLDAELRAARIVLFEVAHRWETVTDGNGREECLSDVALAKLKVTEAAVFATDHAMRIAGGPGFSRGELERAFRDARAGLIHPPLEDVAYQEFAKKLIQTYRPPCF